MAEGNGAKKADYTSKSGVDIVRARNLIAKVVWGICLVFALVLALGALLIALKANENNGLVTFIQNFAGGVDLGAFDKDNGVFTFTDKNVETREIKNALVNWGLGAVVWLIIGRVAERLIRP